MSTKRESLILAQQRHLIDQVLANDAMARRFGLSGTELQLLHLLALRRDLQTARQLAEVAQLPTSTVSNMLDRLERSGFVERERSVADRRRVIITLTARSAEIGEQYAAGEAAQRMDDALLGFTSEQVQAVLTYFNRLHDIVHPN